MGLEAIMLSEITETERRVLYVAEGGFEGEGIHGCVWLSSFAIYLKLPQDC